MKKHLLYVIMAGLLLTGCGSKGEVLEPPANQPEVQKEDAAADVEQNDDRIVNEEENKDSGDTAEIINVSLLGLKKETICQEEWGNYGIICQSVRDSVHLDEETKTAYPELSQSLTQLRNEQIEEITLFMDNFVGMAQEEAATNEDFYGYTSECEFFVQRADDQMLSIRETYYEYTGGARPMSGNFGENFDTATGKRLLITDVVKDLPQLIEILDEKLIEKYGEEAFYDAPEKLMKETSPEYFQWTMSYQGLSVYFSAMDVGAYGINQPVITIWFNEYPQLFAEKYMAAMEMDYAMHVPANEEIAIDIKPGDEKKDTLRIWNTAGYSELVFQVNGQDYYTEEGYLIGDADYYLVCLKNDGEEKYYVYAQLGYELYHQIQVYELTENGGVRIGSLDREYVPEEWNSETDSAYMAVFNDPSEFELYSRTNWVGVVTGVRGYQADFENPVPKAQTDYYDISNDWYQLTLKKPIELEILPEETKEVIPEGTTFRYLRTDNDTYVDFLLEDGRECRVYTENWDGEAAIQGDYPDAYFEGLPNGF